MKQLFVIPALALAMASPLVANAATGQTGKDSETMKVSAFVAAPICDFNLNDSQPANFGVIEPTKLTLHSVYTLPEQQVTMTVDCKGKTLVRMTVEDKYLDILRAKNAPGMRHDPTRQFGLVDVSNPAETKLFGSYTIEIKTLNATIDGAISQPGMSAAGRGRTNEIFSSKTATGVEPETMVFGDGNVYANKIDAVFNVIPTILPASTLDLGRDVDLVGETTFKMVYM